MDTKKCGKCGTENPSNATFCSECGENLPEVKNNPINKGISYWKNQKKGFKILTGFLGCCIGAFIILMIIAAVFPTTNLSLANTTANIDNQTTEYMLIGHTEPNATIKLSSKSLNLNGVEITPDSNGTFEYKLEIPTNISNIDVTVTAKVPNKSENRATATIKRPSTTNSTKTTSTNQVFENQYVKFEYPQGYTVTDKSTGSSIKSLDVVFNKGSEQLVGEVNVGSSDPSNLASSYDVTTIAGRSAYVYGTSTQDNTLGAMIELGELGTASQGFTYYLDADFDKDCSDAYNMYKNTIVIKQV